MTHLCVVSEVREELVIKAVPPVSVRCVDESRFSYLTTKRAAVEKEIVEWAVAQRQGIVALTPVGSYTSNDILDSRIISKVNTHHRRPARG